MNSLYNTKERVRGAEARKLGPAVEAIGLRESVWSAMHGVVDRNTNDPHYATLETANPKATR